MNNITCLYFSATGTTRKCAMTVAKEIGENIDCKEINLADNIDIESLTFGKGDLLIVGSPVYGGRLPRFVAEALSLISGNGAKAIAMVVFGNL